MSKTSSSHCWVLHSESLQYIENVHKCIHVWFFLLLQKFWNFLSLFKRSFLFVPHITPDIFLSLCFFNFQSLRRERDANGGCQAHVILPCFCPISHKGLVQGKSKARRGFRALSVLQMLIFWVDTGDMTCILWQWHIPSPHHPKAAGAGRTRGRDTAFAAGGLFAASDEISHCSPKFWFHLHVNSS